MVLTGIMLLCKHAGYRLVYPCLESKYDTGGKENVQPFFLYSIQTFLHGPYLMDVKYSGPKHKSGSFVPYFKIHSGKRAAVSPVLIILSR